MINVNDAFVKALNQNPLSGLFVTDPYDTIMNAESEDLTRADVSELLDLAREILIFAHAAKLPEFKQLFDMIKSLQIELNTIVKEKIKLVLIAPDNQSFESAFNEVISHLEKGWDIGNFEIGIYGYSFTFVKSNS